MARAWAAADAGEVVLAARCWLADPALAAVADALGAPPLRVIPDDLPGFAEWSKSALNSRGGAERHEAAAVSLPGELVLVLLDAGHALGMMATPGPALARYDATVILGGTVTGNRLRAELAGSLDRRGVDLGVVVALGAHRPLTEKDRATTDEPAGGGSEWQDLLRAVRDAFGPAPGLPAQPAEQPGGFQAAIDRPFKVRGGRLTLRLLVAPSRSGERRADTSDSLDYLIRCVSAPQRRTILLVTSAIYAPYQFFAAAPLLLANGARHVELVGTPTQEAGNRELLAQRIAQEINSAVSVAARLWTPG